MNEYNISNSVESNGQTGSSVNVHYVRGSNKKQSMLKQLELAEQVGYDELIIEHHSARGKIPPLLHKALLNLPEGSIITFSNVSRCTRNMSTFLEAEELAKIGNIALIFLREKINTSQMTPYERKILLCAVAEAECFSNESSENMYKHHGRQKAEVFV